MCSAMFVLAGSIQPFEFGHVGKGCRNKLWPCGRVAVWPCGRVAVWLWPCGRVAGWPGGRVAGWPGGRVAGWPGGRVAVWPVAVAGWPWPWAWPGGRVGRVGRVARWPWPGRGRDGRQLKKAIVKMIATCNWIRMKHFSSARCVSPCVMFHRLSLNQWHKWHHLIIFIWMLPIGMLDLLDGFGQATWVLCCRNVTWTLGAELRVKGASSKSDGRRWVLLSSVER